MCDSTPAFAPATLIVVGTPPSGAECPTGITRLVHFEPEAAQSAKLSVPASATVDLYDALPAPKTGTGTLTRYNFPGLRSLSPATPGLMRLLPGIQAQFSQDITLAAISDLSEYLMTLPQPIQLDLWIVGHDLVVLEALEAAGALACIAAVRMRIARHALFEGSEDLQSVLSWTARRGFLPVSVNEEETLLPEVLLRLDAALGQHFSDLRAGKLQALQEDLDRRTEERDALARTCDVLRGERDAVLTERDGLRGERDALITECDGLKVERDTLTTEGQDRAKALALAEEYRAKAQARITELEAERNDQQQALKEVAQTKADLSVALRLQAAMANDLAELRARYRLSEETRLQQLGLLQQLTPRLQQAATEVRHLLQSADAENLPDPDPEADAGAAADPDVGSGTVS